MEKTKADQIITEYLQRIYGFAVKQSYSYDEAEELCSDIIEEVYLSLLKTDEIVNVDGYIRRISKHVYARYVASKKRREGVSIDGMEIPVYDEYSFDNDDAELEMKRLRREIAFLSSKRRTVVYLFYYEDRSIAYIAKKLGMPEGTVKWHLNKARFELKEGFSMERKIGNLGLNPISADNFGHSGNSGSCGGPEYYLNDKLNLNIVYSVYHSPKTKEEIAEELGLTLVFIEEKIDYLEENGFLVKTSGERYTTYVKFTPQKYSLELKEKKLKTQLKIAQMLAKEYVPIVREAFGNFEDVYIPGGNRELFEASVIFDALASKCGLTIGKNLSRYWIKTTDGGRYIATVHTDSERADPDYVSELDLPSYWACGHMTRQSEKYPSVCSWAIDSRLSSREGAWQNNLTSDYEYMYEYISGMIEDNAANSEKFARLRSRKFITDDGRPNILIVNSSCKDYENMLPALDEATKSKFADLALELAMAEAKSYPPQMQDLVVRWGVEGLIGVTVAIMVMDILYADGTLSPLDENEKVTSNLIMFCDKLPE